MRDRYVAGATPEWRVSLYWSDRIKAWSLVLQDRDGQVVERQLADTTVALDAAAARLLLRAMAGQLELLLPI